MILKSRLKLSSDFIKGIYYLFPFGIIYDAKNFTRDYRLSF